MVRELRRCDTEEQRRRHLFALARGLAEESGAHVAVVAFSPAGGVHAFGGPTVDSVLRTHVPSPSPPDGSGDGAPPPHPPSASAETAGEAAARVAGMRRDREEIRKLVTEEWARVADTREKVVAAQAAARKTNWWEVDVEALGEEELPVFIRALELLRSDVKGRLDVGTSARLSLLPCRDREKKQQQ